MKYDEQNILTSENYPNENIVRQTTKRKKFKALDIVLVQSIICAVISCGILISRLAGLGM